MCGKCIIKLIIYLNGLTNWGNILSKKIVVCDCVDKTIIISFVDLEVCYKFLYRLRI